MCSSPVVASSRRSSRSSSAVVPPHILRRPTLSIRRVEQHNNADNNNDDDGDTGRPSSRQNGLFAIGQSFAWSNDSQEDDTGDNRVTKRPRTISDGKKDDHTTTTAIAARETNINDYKQRRQQHRSDDDTIDHRAAAAPSPTPLQKINKWFGSNNSINDPTTLTEVDADKSPSNELLTWANSVSSKHYSSFQN